MLGALREILASRELFLALVARNLTVRYQRSVVGFAWTLLNPAITTVILVFVFQSVLRMQLPQYWAFLISGYFPWVFALHTLGQAPSVVTSHSYMARSLPFPAEVLVASTVCSRLIEFAAELLLVVVVLCVYRHQGVPASLAFLPLLVVIQAILLTGLALPIAALAVFFEDVQHAVPTVLVLLGLLSPVYYPVSYVPESLRTLFLANPFAVLLELYHAVLYDGRLPSLQLLALSAVTSVAVLIVGATLFRWKRAYFAEIV